MACVILCNATILIFRSKFKKGAEGSVQDHLVVIQCDSGHLYSDLIACAHNRMFDLLARGDKEQTTHVLFIIHLPRQLTCSLVGFQGDPWISCHIDDLMPSDADSAVELDQVLGETLISDLFMGNLLLNEKKETCEEETSMSSSYENQYDHSNSAGIDSNESSSEVQFNGIEDTSVSEDDKDNGEQCQQSEMWEDSSESLDSKVPPSTSQGPSVHPTRKPFYRNLYKCIQPAASKLKDITMKRSTERVNILVGLIPKDIGPVGELLPAHFVASAKSVRHCQLYQK